MAVGLLGKSNPSANTSTLVYTVPSGVISSFNISAVNMGLVDANVTVYISDGSTTSADRLIESNTVIPANGGVLEREGLLCNAGETVYVSASSANIAFRVHGFED